MPTQTTACLSFLLSLFLLTAPSASAEPARSLCQHAGWLEAGDSVRGEIRTAGQPDCYQLQPTADGMLALEASVFDSTNREPRLSLHAGCGLSLAGSPTKRASSPSQILIKVRRAQPYLVCVGDPSQPLGRYTLRTAFLDADTLPKDEPIEVEPVGGKDEPIEVEPVGNKDEPIEVEPVGNKDEPIEVEPVGGKDEPIEVEPVGLLSPPTWLTKLCKSAVDDDHSDLRLCATPLTVGSRIDGEIAGDWGDDQDLFAFEVSEPSTIALTLDGEVAATLYNRFGQRLVTPDVNKSARSQLIKTLAPGHYFVRVAGEAWTTGGYRLQLDTLQLDW